VKDFGESLMNGTSGELYGEGFWGVLFKTIFGRYN